MKYGSLFGVILLTLLGACSTGVSWMDEELGASFVHDFKSKKLTSVDPKNSDFPGGRGSHHLVVYTPEFGSTTSTNEWGSEAIVQRGRVVSVGGNNSSIPQDGFVVSGNESASRWINDHLVIGTEVKLNKGILEYSNTENTYVYQAKSIYKKALARLEKTKMGNDFGDYDKRIEKSFKLFQKAKADKNNVVAKAESRKILEIVQDAYYSTFEPCENEFKGVWIRLADKTPQELKETIKKIADAGINAILPETIYNGYAIYPNAHELLPQLPQFKGWDPMQVMVEECKKYGIKIVPWCEMFFVGGKNSPVVKNKSQWIGKFRHGEIYAELEPGFHYLCPSRPEVHQFLLATMDTLLNRYPLKEVQLDYIRYSLSEPWDKGFCYCDFCKNKVKKKLGFDINKISPTNEKEWTLWNKYRANNISSFVKSVNDLLSTKHPEVQLSADVFPDPKLSLKHKFQDWKSWVEKDQLDAVYIMSYSTNNEIVIKDSEFLQNIAKGTNIKPIVGLGPYMGFQPELLLEQIEIARNHGASGVCLFSFNALNEEQLEALKKGPFRAIN